jgi:hypothetical protein
MKRPSHANSALSERRGRHVTHRSLLCRLHSSSFRVVHRTSTLLISPTHPHHIRTTNGSMMSRANPTAIDSLREGPPTRRDLASICRLAHLRSRSASRFRPLAFFIPLQSHSFSSTCCTVPPSLIHSISRQTVLVWRHTL